MERQLGGGAIPKHIHQIWIGKNPVPVEWIDTVKAFAKEYGYKYTMWNESNIDDLDMESIPGLPTLYKNFGHQLAGQADIIRLLALYKYGGIYIDADTVIMKPAKFAAFLEKNRAAVFFGWENLSVARTRKLKNIDPGIRKSRRMVANGLIGAQKKHPFFKKLLDTIVENAALPENIDKRGKPAAWKSVGPHFVTRTFNSVRKEFPDIHIYPMKYFYPRHWGGITDPELHTKVKIPGQSMLFQYGYSTNSFHKIFKERAKTRRNRKD